MAEEELNAAADSGGDEQFTADDWAAAMAEQAAADSTESEPVEEPQASAARAAIFNNLSADPGLTPEAAKNLELVMDIPVQMTVELGRTRMPIRSLLQLAQGSVVELNELAGEPLDVFVNGCLVAQGEVVVVNEKFGIRLTDIITPSERLKKLK
ncbi:flagellar motor switch protein FliN/FliY [Novimethylophilus kurashikiensis]|uniref:Flagellar motor switch protein FliN n=1 Tax=Novimethylophilus kurashikiensis TaxID=1825523 RepID=A0A2R5F337_9PROT|nr:flagellar motor switch protein FliN [Novimethylophilus kurashikiensis]GBG12569.1 flagellar motor switch protein FliN/FliY [Novimethylophilus kurashikiensis]